MEEHDALLDFEAPERILTHALQGTLLKPPQMHELEKLESEALGELFAHSSYLASAAGALAEQHWLLLADSEKFSELVEAAFDNQLASLGFLRPLLNGALSAKELKAFAKAAGQLRRKIALNAAQRPTLQLNEVATRALQCLQSLREQTYDSFLEPALYRSFDDLDLIFNLDYSRDLKMRRDTSSDERLYEGAGIGVQSSYVTVLVALEQINPAQGARFIDLGSGYGRVGLAIGLCRPDLSFTGYEFVEHRVEVSNRAAQRLGISDRIQFLTQDLSAPSFLVPEADVYYLFDPFTEATYRFVLEQLCTQGERRAVTLAAKGFAVGWIQKAVAGRGWHEETAQDEGTLTVFRSPASAGADDGKAR